MQMSFDRRATAPIAKKQIMLDAATTRVTIWAKQHIAFQNTVLRAYYHNKLH
jgi:hypothetical protein